MSAYVTVFRGVTKSQSVFVSMQFRKEPLVECGSIELPTFNKKRKE